MVMGPCPTRLPALGLACQADPGSAEVKLMDVGKFIAGLVDHILPADPQAGDTVLDVGGEVGVFHQKDTQEALLILGYKLAFFEMEGDSPLGEVLLDLFK
jgi:hypothetical protein